MLKHEVDCRGKLNLKDPAGEEVADRHVRKFFHTIQVTGSFVLLLLLGRVPMLSDLHRPYGSIRPHRFSVAILVGALLATTMTACANAADDKGTGRDDKNARNKESIPRGDEFSQEELEKQNAPKGLGPQEEKDKSGRTASEGVKGTKTESSDAQSLEKLSDLKSRDTPETSPTEPEAIPKGEEFERGSPAAAESKKAPVGEGPEEVVDMPQDEKKPQQSKNDEKRSDELKDHRNKSEEPQGLAPPLDRNFEGIRTNSFPADCHIAVGPNHLVQAVNSWMRVTSKTGGGVIDVSFATFFSNTPSGARTPFDPWIAYDHFSRRWVLLTVTMSADRKTSWYMIAASKTDDPTGGWWLYSWRADLDGTTDTDNWADYPKFGFDNQNIYVTSNQFAASGGFQYAKLRAFAKNPLYNGQTISGVDWKDIKRADNTKAFTIQPCLTFGAPAKEYLIETTSGAGNKVTMWTVEKNLSALTRVATVTVGSWSPPDKAQQNGSTELVDSGDARLLGAVFRDARVYTCHTVKTARFPSACRYIVIDTSNFSKKLDVAFGASASYYYYPATMVDSAGTIFSVFSYSSGSAFIGTRYTARKNSDTQFQNSSLLKTGQATYVQKDSIGRNRWGDYNGIAVDPSGGVWFNAMYARLATNTWGSWVGFSRGQ